MGPRWLINRLKLMSVGEVAYRIKQRLGSSVERMALALGRHPHTQSAVTTRHIMLDREYLPRVGAGMKSQSSAVPILRGKLSIFDYHELDIGWPINWHRDPLTGVTSPAARFGKSIDYRDKALVGDIKVLWELGRQQYLVPIAIEYLEKREQAQLDVIEGILSSWMSQNAYGYGVHWCSALEVSLRAISWCISHQILLAAGLPNGIFSLQINKGEFEKHIFQHATFIRGHLSLYSSANNHLIGELTGLNVICSVFSLGDKGEKWAAFAWESILEESQKQVFPDGVNKEQAVYYHCWVLEYLIINYLMEAHKGTCIPESYVSQLTRMAQFLRDLAPEGANPPQIGDADDGVAILFALGGNPFHVDLLATINALAGELTFTQYGNKAFWYQALLQSVKAPTARPHLVKQTEYPSAFPDGGYAVLGSPAFHAVFDAGSLGYPSIAAHGHADMLNICLAIDGVWWLVDPGTYAYHSDPEWRNYFRGSHAHNVLTVNQCDQSEIGGPFMWVRHATARFGGVQTAGVWQSTSGSHNGFNSVGASEVSRSVDIDAAAEFMSITDKVICDQPLDIGLKLHFAPEIHCVTVQPNVYLLKHGAHGPGLRVEFPVEMVVTSYCGDEKSHLGWYSSALGKKEPCLTLQATTKIKAVSEFTTILRVVR